MRFKLPKLSKPSYVLTKELLGLLYLSNAFIQTSKEIQFLSSSSVNFFNFEEFAQIITSKIKNLFILIVY